MQKAQIWTGALFTALLLGGALAISSSISAVLQLATQGTSAVGLADLAGSVAAVGLVVLGTIFLLHRLDLNNGTIRTRIPAFEVGWVSEE